MTKNYITPTGISANSINISISFTKISINSIGISTKQSLHIDISVLVQETPFIDLQRKKINRLLKKGVFVVIIERDIPQSICIFNSRFVNKIKHPNINKTFKKSRLIV